MPKIKDYSFYGYEVDSPVFIIDSELSYADANFALLNPSIRNSLFLKERPIYTKVRDDAPAKYGPFSAVSNSLIADGCVVEGEVQNSVLFRGVHVKKGAVIKNSIIMQDTTVGENADINYVIADKNVTLLSNTEIKGAPTHYMYISKSSVV
jgi:glucose-1-phosphate adenylyltransferase